jgi:type II secretory pathway component PulK
LEIRSSSRHRGSIFVAALWIIIILVAVVLLMARSVRVDATSTSNRQSMLEADAIERGAEQYVMWQVDGAKGDAVSITAVDTEAMPVGTGYFWILRPDSTSDQYYGFGITDEASKLSLNIAASTELQNLPAMTSDVADAIVDWRDADDTVGANGAESEYYLSLQQPYAAKNLPFETVEELQLVKGMTPLLLFGYDLNRNGVLETIEQAASGGSAAINSASSDSRGIFNYVTAWSVEPNTQVDGTARINVNNQDTSALQKALGLVLPANRVSAIIARLSAVYNRGGRDSSNTGRISTATTQGAAATTFFANIGAFYAASGMTADEFGKVADQLTTSTATTLTGLVNVATAPAQVLACLPGLDQNDANTLVSARSSASDLTSIGWVFGALTPASKALAISGAITSRSFIYSADIVAVSGDGRAFKRVRVVVDAQKSPAKVIYRRDLTSLGWPLDPQIQLDLRNGTYEPTLQGSGSGSGLGSGGSPFK